MCSEIITRRQIRSAGIIIMEVMYLALSISIYVCVCMRANACSKLQTRAKVNPNACPSDTAEKERKKKSGPGLIKPSVARSVRRNKTESPPEAPQCRWRLPEVPGSLSLRPETRFQHLHPLTVFYSAIKNTVTPLWPPEDRFVWSRRETCAASPLRSSPSHGCHSDTRLCFQWWAEPLAVSFRGQAGAEWREGDAQSRFNAKCFSFAARAEPKQTGK